MTKRQEARALCLVRYFTGKPCKYGHVVERYVVTRKCAECVRIALGKWRNKNRKLFRINAVRGSRKYREADRARSRRINREYKRRNAALLLALQNERRAKMRSLNLTKEERQEIVALYKRREELSGQTGVMHHVDHIIPLSRGGEHRLANLQILTAVENCRKGAR